MTSSHRFDCLEETDQLLKEHILPKVSPDEIDYLTSPVPIKEIEKF